MSEHDDVGGDVPSERDALRRVGLAVHRMMPRGSVRAEFDFSEVGGVRVASVGFFDEAGHESSSPDTDEAGAAASDLRRLMYRAEVGSWFSARFRVTAAGKLGTSFDFDHRAPHAWIDDQTYLDDLESYPRPAEAIPGWLAAVIASRSAGGSP